MSGNLFNDPHINVPILKKSGNLFNDPGTNVPIKKSLKTFNDTRMNKSAHIKNVWKLI